MTFDELVKLEPKLGDLLREITSLRPRRGYCADREWYKPDGYKARVTTLVGWGRRPPHRVLSTTTAYDVAYHNLYMALPDCRHEGSCVA